MIEYLSPTSLAIWESDPELFYMRYFLKMPRAPQTKPMSVGSAFDARVKAFLFERFLGKSHPKYAENTYEYLFERQVEAQNRDFARAAGDNCFEQYQASGALADMCLELGEAVGHPIFEGKMRSNLEIDTQSPAGPAMILGITDLFFINAEGLRVVDDWKVNGYCSNGNTSPTRGYIRLRPGGKPHRDALLQYYKGIEINVAEYFENISPEWAAQLSTYAWLAGEPIGSENWIAGIDQLACARNGEIVNIRVAEHRTRVSRSFQLALADRYQQAWDILHSDWKFRNLTKEQSLEREEMLGKQVHDLKAGSGESAFDAFMQE